MNVRALPQLCCRCRNRDIGGKLKSPELGRFFRSKKYNRAPVWVCLPCLKNPVRLQRPGLESPAEKKVSIALQCFGEQFIPEFSFGPFIFDFAFPKLKVLMEVDSWTWHHTRSRKQNDARKRRYAEENGWEVVRLRVGPKLERRACELVRACRLLRIREGLGVNDKMARLIYATRYGDQE
jgi:hypothetical protein